MRLTFLDQNKKRTLTTQAQLLGKEWYLAGGTALALHLGHRSSLDLDWFSQQQPDYQELSTALGSVSHRFTSQGEFVPGGSSFRFFYDGLETSFIAFYRFDAKSETMVVDGVPVRVASISHLAAMKAVAISNRLERRDFVDVYAILQAPGWTLAKFLENSEQVAKWPRGSVLEALAKVNSKALELSRMPQPCRYTWDMVKRGILAKL